jgi:hypothetical protein
MDSIIWSTIQEVLETLIYGTVLVAIPVLGNQVRLWLQAKLTAERHQIVSSLAATIVTAVEQEYKNADGSHKLAVATQRLETALADIGVTLELDGIRIAIEAAVFEELTLWKEPSLTTLPKK